MKNHLTISLMAILLVPLHAFGAGAWLDSLDEARAAAAAQQKDLLILYRGENFDKPESSPEPLYDSPHFTDAAQQRYILAEQASPVQKDNAGQDKRATVLIFADATGRPYYNTSPDTSWGMDWLHEELTIAAERRVVVAAIWQEMAERPADRAEWTYACRLFAELALGTELYYEPYRALLAEAAAHGDDSQEARRTREKRLEMLSNEVFGALSDKGFTPEFEAYARANADKLRELPWLAQGLRVATSLLKFVSLVNEMKPESLFEPAATERVQELGWSCVADEPRTRTARYVLTQVIHAMHTMVLADLFRDFRTDPQGTLARFERHAGADTSFRYRQAHSLLRARVQAELGQWDAVLESLELAAGLDPLSENAKAARQMHDSITANRARLEELHAQRAEGDESGEEEWRALLAGSFNLGFQASFASDFDLFYLLPACKDRPTVPQAGQSPLDVSSWADQGLEYSFHGRKNVVVSCQDLKDATQRAYEGDDGAQMYMAYRAEQQGDWPTAFDWLCKAAEQGEEQALAVLGDYYLEGKVVPQDEARAIEYYIQSAEKDYAYAQIVMAQRYLNGDGVPEDAAAAVELYRKAASHGVIPALAQLGVCYINGHGVEKDVSQGLACVRTAAQAGHSSAQLNLGIMYLQGKVVEQDYMQARYWLELAAAQGKEQAKDLLGYIEQEKDPWAADDEDEPLVLALGNESITLQHKNPEEARAAAEQGDETAQLYFAVCEEDAAKRIALLRPIAEKGNRYAQALLGTIYTEGVGVERDDVQAAHWYGLAAAQGDARAQCIMGALCEQGRGVPQDIAKAFEWYRLSAEQGDAYGMACLAGCYADGKGVAKDLKVALEGFRKAADKGNADAQYTLGLMYMEGTGVPRDLDQAQHWLELADKQGHDGAQESLFELRMLRAKEKK